MRAAIYTLGCKVNQYETQAMEQLLTELGHEIGQFDQPCDGYIINTCSVIFYFNHKKFSKIPCLNPDPCSLILFRTMHNRIFQNWLKQILYYLHRI